MSAIYKVSGGGNDFLALAAPEREPSADEIRSWCARGLSFGADGLFTLQRVDAGGVRMRYWNADGLPAALCLNGTRCAARLALHLGWTEATFPVATDAGTFAARAVAPTEIALQLPAPDDLPRRRVVEIDGRTHEGWFVTVGVPHLILIWSGSLAQAPVAALGAALRAHAEFAPAGTNVDFVRFPTPNRMEIRSFERGVEAETLACGTGVLAATAVGLQLNLAKLPLQASTLGGFTLTVDGQTVDTALRNWSLAGDARILGSVELTPEAGLPAPPAPQWSA
ncbi:MAG: diaminopimelate epimerase [Thermoanaerobaculia bacterium]